MTNSLHWPPAVHLTQMPTVCEARIANETANCHLSYLEACVRSDSLTPHLTHLEDVRGSWQGCIGGLIQIGSVTSVLYRCPMSVPNAAGLSRIWVQ